MQPLGPFALVGEQERGFQEELIRGDAPLGPGAAPRERLIAFGEHYLDFLDEHGDVLAAADEVTAPNSEDGVAQVLERWF